MLFKRFPEQPPNFPLVQCETVTSKHGPQKKQLRDWPQGRLHKTSGNFRCTEINRRPRKSSSLVMGLSHPRIRTLASVHLGCDASARVTEITNVRNVSALYTCGSYPEEVYERPPPPRSTLPPRRICSRNTNRSGTSYPRQMI